MNRPHVIPAIYNPDISHSVKCDIMGGLCQAMAEYKGVTLSEMREGLIEKLNVDFDRLDDNPVGMLLLYEYLYSQRPVACRNGEKKTHH